MMKNAKNSLNLLIIGSIILFLSGCAATVNFVYDHQPQTYSIDKVNTAAKIYLTIKDMRADPEVIGYIKNQYGMRMTEVRPQELDVSKTIYSKFKDEFASKGFIFTDDATVSDLKLTLSITTFLGEISQIVFIMSSEADCCMNVILESSKDTKSIYNTTVCGTGSKSPVLGTKKDIPVALSMAIDDVLGKILNDSVLIRAINKY